MRAEPMRISPRNLKQIWSSNMSVNCSFAASDPSVYVSSLKKRNSLRLWVGCSTELNTFIGKMIGVSRDPFHASSKLKHLCSITSAVFNWTFISFWQAGGGGASTAFSWFLEQPWQLRSTIHRKFVNIPQMVDVARRLHGEGGIPRLFP